MTSPAETLSPFFFFHATSVPSVIVSLNLGIWISGMANHRVGTRTFSLCAQRSCTPLKAEQRIRCPLGAQARSLCSALSFVIWISGIVGLLKCRVIEGLKRVISLASTLHRFNASRITNFFDRGDELLLVRQNCFLQSFVVWHGHIFLRDAHNRCVELVENVLFKPKQTSAPTPQNGRSCSTITTRCVFATES